MNGAFWLVFGGCGDVRLLRLVFDTVALRSEGRGTGRAGESGVVLAQFTEWERAEPKVLPHRRERLEFGLVGGIGLLRLGEPRSVRRVASPCGHSPKG